MILKAGKLLLILTLNKKGGDVKNIFDDRMFEDYGEAAVTLARSFPNCFIDQCWLWIMNPSAGVRYLKEFIMGAPSSKLFAFGSDYWHPEGISIIGHLDIARHGVCIALNQLVQEGWIIPDDALTIAENIFYKNQQKVFDLKI